MKYSPIITFTFAFTVLLGAGAYVYGASRTRQIAPVPMPTATSATSSPSAPPVSPASSPSPSSATETYTNSELGISFRYPVGYYVIEEPTYRRLEIQNVNYRLTGLPGADFRMVTIQYGGSNAAGEDAAKGQRSVRETDGTGERSTVHFYEYPNPNNSEMVIAEAFWIGNYSFSASMLWDRTDTSQAEQEQETDEVALLRDLVSTLTVSH